MKAKRSLRLVAGRKVQHPIAVVRHETIRLRVLFIDRGSAPLFKPVTVEWDEGLQCDVARPMTDAEIAEQRRRV